MPNPSTSIKAETGFDKNGYVRGIFGDQEYLPSIEKFNTVMYMSTVVGDKRKGVCWLDRWEDREMRTEMPPPRNFAMAYLQRHKCPGSILAFLDRTHKWPKCGAWRCQMGPCGCLRGESWAITWRSTLQFAIFIEDLLSVASLFLTSYCGANWKEAFLMRITLIDEQSDNL